MLSLLLLMLADEVLRPTGEGKLHCVVEGILDEGGVYEGGA